MSTLLEKIKKDLNSNFSIFGYWFSGLALFFYLICNFIFNYENAKLDYFLYFSLFGISILFFVNLNFFKIKINNLIKTLLSLIFLFFVFKEVSLDSLKWIFIFSVTLVFVKCYINKEIFLKYQNFTELINYFVVFAISSKIFYFKDLNNFIFLKINEGSGFIDLQKFIELLTPIIIIVIFLFFSILIFLSLKVNYKNKNNFNLHKLWWAVPLLIFFLESFSTNSYFIKAGGGSFHHWQPFTGVIEMMQQGGLLLWDTPSQYGFLSLIFTYLIPFENPWLKVYILNGVFNLILSLLIFYVIWYKRNLYWYVFSLFFTYSIYFALPGGPWFNNISISPSAIFRVFWAILLIFVIYKIQLKEIFTQLKYIIPIWLVGFFWSFESAVYVTSVIGTYFLSFIFLGKSKINSKIYVLLSFPASILICLILICLFYLININNLPDFLSFVEFVFGWFLELKNINTNLQTSNINPFGIILVILFFFSLFLNNHIVEKNKYLWFAVFGCCWAILSYFISISDDHKVLGLVKYFCLGMFLLINNLNKNDYNLVIKYISPLLLFVLIYSYGNPSLLIHVKKTLSNQNYSLNKVIYEKDNELDNILNLIKPNDIPVLVVEKGRYLNYLHPNNYVDQESKKIIFLNDEIFLPIQPASMFIYLSQKRKSVYINRWIKRHKSNNGWIITDKSHWHNSINSSLSKINQNFNTIKEIELGPYQAVLYKKRED